MQHIYAIQAIFIVQSSHNKNQIQFENKCQSGVPKRRSVRLSQKSRRPELRSRRGAPHPLIDSASTESLQNTEHPHLPRESTTYTGVQYSGGIPLLTTSPASSPCHQIRQILSIKQIAQKWDLKVATSWRLTCHTTYRSHEDITQFRLHLKSCSEIFFSFCGGLAATPTKKLNWRRRCTSISVYATPKHIIQTTHPPWRCLTFLSGWWVRLLSKFIIELFNFEQFFGTISETFLNTQMMPLVQTTSDISHRCSSEDNPTMSWQW